MDYRTTKEEQIPVDADGLLHFDAFDSLYALAHNVMEYQEAMDSIQYEESKRELTEAEEYLNKLH